MRARVQQGDRGVNGGEGRAVAWPGGEAAMAPQARRGDDGELVLWWRRARSSGVVMAKLSKVAARRLRAQQARAAAVQRARACALERSARAASTQRGGRGRENGYFGQQF